MENYTENYVLEKNKTTWIGGKDHEVNFWRNYFSNQGGKWNKEYQQRQNPKRNLQDYVLKYLRHTNSMNTTVKLLDVGSGPLTALGKVSPNYNIEITAVDPLANEYDQILSEFNITPLVRTKYCAVEQLSNYFPANHFDFIHIRNALDHSYDPLLGIFQMLEVVKKGNYILIHTAINEGKNENYQGFHQWNLYHKNDQFLIGDKQGNSRSVNDEIKDLAVVKEIKTANSEQWMSIAIKKRKKILTVISPSMDKRKILSPLSPKQVPMKDKLSCSKSSKDDWIKKIVVDKSFADIGGLWGTVNEKISVAIKAQAKRAAMIDITPLNHKVWQEFHNHCSNMGITNYDSLQADVTRQNLSEKIGKFDVIHCSGIIYHVPDPFSLLLNLHSVVKEYLILSSMTIPSVIVTDDGSLTLAGGLAYSVPLLNKAQKKFFATYFNNKKLNIAHINGKLVENWINPNNCPKFGPWWWLWTPDYLKNMLEICRFEVIEVAETWEGRAHSFLCRALS